MSTHTFNRWQVKTLRMTAFCSPMSQITEPTWWADLMSEPPEKRTSQPRRGGQREEGPLAKGKLVLSAQPNRIDWLYTVADDAKFEGKVIQVSECFQKLLKSSARS